MEARKASGTSSRNEEMITASWVAVSKEMEKKVNSSWTEHQLDSSSTTPMVLTISWSCPIHSIRQARNLSKSSDSGILGVTPNGLELGQVTLRK